MIYGHCCWCWWRCTFWDEDVVMRAKISIFVFAPLFSPALVREREFTFKLTAIHTAHTSI